MNLDVATMAPAQARQRFRDGQVTPTAGWSAGYAQANLIAVPRDYAFDLMLFAQRNPKPCPVLDVLEPGQYSGPLLADGDVRTDIPAYRIYVDGEFVTETTDATEYWTDDLVAFLIGCSFSFEAALLDSGIPVRHIEEDVNVPMYRTDRPCRARGGSGVRWWCRCGRCRRSRWLTPCASRRATRRCTAPRYMSGIPRGWASLICPRRTMGIRSPSAPGRSRCSGRVGSPRRLRSCSPARRWPSVTRRATC